MTETTNTITPEEKAQWHEDHKNWAGRDSDLVVRVRLMDALEAADGLAIKLKADIDAGAKDYCTLMDKHDAQFVRAEQAEAESAKLREQVSALLELYEAGMDLMDACMAESEAISAHDDYQTGRTLSTEIRLKNARASLFAAYDKATKVRERCEALGLNVTPCQQGAHDA